jgi:exopolysaccharide biosynthesis polyprenyl glycosylphosphotransferase
MHIHKKSYNLLLIDYLTSVIAWILFFYFRKTHIEFSTFIRDKQFYLGILCIPFFWLLLYALQGTYSQVKRLYRIQIIQLTILGTTIGVLSLFFLLLLDDVLPSHQSYYKSLLALFLIHFGITLIPRFLIVSRQVKKIQERKDGFKTILIGGNEKALQIFNELEQLENSIGAKFIGYIRIKETDTRLDNKLHCLGKLDDLSQILDKNAIEEVIIAIESNEHEILSKLIASIQGKGIKIKIIPDMYDFLSGSLKLNNLFGALLLEIPSDEMPPWQKSIKRLLDISISLISILLLLPLYAIIAILIKQNSKGPIFFLQKRVGKNGIPFQIIKFRTMFVNAEQNGPQLSSTNDSRITPIGRFLRKTRIDEFPQFVNVLKGDMSLVGPRPERQHYIDQIIEKEPHYLQLTSVRPGITSWGQVKFGYAENVNEMIRRMKYDLLYLKNRSLSLDFKIMFYTVITILKAKGK